MILLFSITSDAKSLNLDFFKDKPKSLTKDFYIAQFLDQGATDAQAKILLPQVKNLNPKLFKKFAKHIDDFKRKAYCQKLKGAQFLGHSADCVQMGLSLYKVTKLDSTLSQKIASHIEASNPSLAIQYLAIASKKFSNLLKLPPKLVINTFNNVGNAFRVAHYDHKLSQAQLRPLIAQKGFNQSIEKIVRGKFPNLQRSLLDIDAQTLDAESNFLLAMNALRFEEPALALRYLRLSQKKATFTFEQDKALFWRYLLTQDATLLHTLTQSHEVNLYSLYAFEKLGKYPNNILYSVQPKVAKPSLIDIQDPFAWIKLKTKVKKMSFQSYEAKKAWVMQYNTPEMEPHISRLLYRFKNNLHYYLTPYKEALQKANVKRQVLIYALARQESHFIPTEVSYSYALGMMQFMPFVAKDIAKKHHIQDFHYEDMFNPKIAYAFANIHLNFLEKSVTHPLYIAYAYNAGIGFTKRNILSKGYFKGGKYEPFYSLEMVPNAQARKYGKRVLSNYAIYAKHLGLDISLSSLLETLK